MKETREHNYQSLLQQLDLDTEAELLSSLLGSVRKRKRQRKLTVRFAAAAVLCICGIAITFKTEKPALPNLAFSEIHESGKWTEIESRAQFTEVASRPNLEFETVSFTVNTPPQAVDEQGLIDLFRGRPIMISYAPDAAKNKFWLLEKNAL